MQSRHFEHAAKESELGDWALVSHPLGLCSSSKGPHPQDVLPTVPVTPRLGWTPGAKWEAWAERASCPLAQAEVTKSTWQEETEV